MIAFIWVSLALLTVGYVAVLVRDLVRHYTSAVMLRAASSR